MGENKHTGSGSTPYTNEGKEEEEEEAEETQWTLRVVRIKDSVSGCNVKTSGMGHTCLEHAQVQQNLP
eukprot:1161324-Pelagomonas_calceolata.AAC.5